MADFREATDGTLIKHLPIVHPRYHLKNEMKTPSGMKSIAPGNYSLNFDKFQSIFDAAAIGQYLGGIDAGVDADRTMGFINESCVFDCSKLKFEWRKDEEGRYVLIGSYDGEEFAVNTLHVHSKNPKRFYSARQPLSETECDFRSGRYSSNQIQILETLFDQDCKLPN